MFKGIRDAFLYIFRYPQFLYAVWRLYRIRKPIITVFGGRNVPTHHEFYKKAYELSKKLMHFNVSIITGGGPGIMDAALCGAQKDDNNKNTLGIAVSGVDEYFSSSCRASSVFLPNFAMRKWLLMHYSLAFIIFPGGIGTLDELTELLNLIKIKKIPKLPVILIDSDYWKPFVDWVHVAMLHGLLFPDFDELFIVTDDIEQACNNVVTYLKSRKY